MNPFTAPGVYGLHGEPVETIGAVDRIHMVRHFNVEQCAAALDVPDLQKTVRVQIERRQRELARLHP